MRRVSPRRKLHPARVRITKCRLDNATLLRVLRAKPSQRDQACYYANKAIYISMRLSMCSLSPREKLPGPPPSPAFAGALYLEWRIARPSIWLGRRLWLPSTCRCVSKSPLKAPRRTLERDAWKRKRWHVGITQSHRNIAISNYLLATTGIILFNRRKKETGILQSIYYTSC